MTQWIGCSAVLSILWVLLGIFDGWDLGIGESNFHRPAVQSCRAAAGRLQHPHKWLQWWLFSPSYELLSPQSTSCGDHDDAETCARFVSAGESDSACDMKFGRVFCWAFLGPSQQMYSAALRNLVPSARLLMPRATPAKSAVVFFF